MINPEEFSVDQIVETFRNGDAATRAALVQSCPSTKWSDKALMAAKMDMPEMRAQALEFLAQGCMMEGPFDLGAKVGEACYRLAKEFYSDGPGDADTYRMIAGRVVLTWMDSLFRLGQHREAVALITEPIEWLEAIGDRDNLDMLRLKRVNAHLNLEEYDAAERDLNAIDEASLPAFVGMSYRSARHMIEQHKGGATSLPDEVETPGRGDLLRILAGDADRETTEEMSPEDYTQLKDTAAEITRRVFGGSDNEFTVRQRIVEASYLFMDEKKGRDPAEIEKIIPVLITGREWMKEHNFPDLENDASWTLYLCYSRTDRTSLAADELLRIRSNIESARSKIAEPVERARLSERYPLLYAALCDMLYKTGRTEELYESIEASKGRVLADLQTMRAGRPADEAQFGNAVRALPGFMERFGSHYFTAFVDDPGVYCVLVTREGEMHAQFVEIERARLAKLASIRDPSLWGRKDPSDPLGPRIPSDVPQRLLPLVEWLRPMLESGVLESGDHICYSPHDTLLAIPFHYIDFDGKPLVERFSVSRMHGAHALVETLRIEPSMPDSFVALHVPSLQDAQNEEKLAAFERPTNWLRANIGEGVVIEKEQADITHLAATPLQGRVIHFAAHGTFPEGESANRDPNPYRSAGVVLAADGQLPDMVELLQGRADEHLFTPEKAIQLGLDCTGSHITLQACVSGLAKRGYGGAALGPEWAFLQLGATSLLSTHWDTSASTSTEFVEHFYRRWLSDRESRSSAWRNTILELRGDRDTSDPHHWAAFSLSGDWR